MRILAVSILLLCATTLTYAQSDAPADGLVEAVMPDSVQVVEIEVTPRGYSVDGFALKVGIPARLIFTRTEPGGCGYDVAIPAFGIEPTDLPVGTPVAIEFTPTEDGRFTFACGMNMLKGIMLVVAS